VIDQHCRLGSLNGTTHVLEREHCSISSRCLAQDANLLIDRGVGSWWMIDLARVSECLDLIVEIQVMQYLFPLIDTREWF
jgi:hypothetical protein